MKVTSLGRAARSKAAIKVRQPLAKVIVKVKTKSEGDSLKKLQNQVIDELNVKEMTVTTEASDLVNFEIKPNLVLLGPKYGKDLGRIRAKLNELDPQEVATKARAGNEIQVDNFSLLSDEILVTMKSKPGYAIAEDGEYVVGVATEISPDLADEGLAREIVHRLQTMRRSAGFDIADYIETYYKGDEGIRQVMTRFSSYIKQETLSKKLVEGKPPDGAYVEKHKLEANEVSLAVRTS
jgi:isoleucyl-tRNA synthetase